MTMACRVPRPNRSTRVVAALVIVGACAWATRPAPLRAVDAAPSAGAVKRLLDEAETLLADGKPGRAKDRLGEAAGMLTVLAEESRPPTGFRTLCTRAGDLRERLDLEGVDVSALDVPSGVAAKAARPAPTDRPAAAAQPGPSFTKEIAPLLVKHCGGCHVSGRRGDFQMTSYDGLMRTGMVQKGAGPASRLVEVILSGDMPRGGGKVPAAELATLVSWIDRGAAYDGTDPALPLTGPPAGPPAATAAAIPQLRGAVTLQPGDVSFAFEVAPVLLQHCAGCHDADDPEGGLRMVSLESLVRGGQTGPAVVPGKSVDSLLIKKLRGTGIEGQQMPLGKPPLATDTIDLIARWIDQGLKLDLLSPKAALADVAAAGRARSLSHEDLARARFAATDGLWRRAIADEEPAVIARGSSLCVFGNLPASRLEEVAQAAGRIEAEVAGALVADGQPLLKGGIALMAFAKPFDYSDFWVNVLGAERPKGLLGGAGIAGDVVYGALVVPEAGQPATELDFRLAEQITAAALVGRGVPAWFANGAARVTAAKLVPKATLAKSWRAEAADRVSAIRSAADLVAGRADPADATPVAAAFFGASGGAAKLPLLVAQLDEGKSFDLAFQQAFRGPPAAVVDGWLARESRKPSRRSP